MLYESLFHVWIRRERVLAQTLPINLVTNNCLWQTNAPTFIYVLMELLAPTLEISNRAKTTIAYN